MGKKRKIQKGILIKTRNYKNGRYIVVLDNGRRVERRKWKRDFQKKQAISKYKIDNSIVQGKRVTILTNVKETTFEGLRKNYKPTKKYKKYQIQATLTLDGKTYYGRSMFVETYVAPIWAERKARENLYLNIHHNYTNGTGSGDEEVKEGKQITEDQGKTREDIKYSTVAWSGR